MKYRFACRRSGGDLFLVHLVWILATAVTFGLAAILYPAGILIYIIDGTEVEVVE